MFYKILLISFALAPCVLGGMSQIGSCSSLKGMAGFDLNKFLKKWHKISVSDKVGPCLSVTFTMGNGVVDVNNAVVNNGITTNTAETVSTPTGGIGTMKTVSSNTLAGTSPSTSKVNYYILATDYDEYALVLACTDATPTTMDVFGWKLARERTGYTGQHVIPIFNSVVASNPAAAALSWNDIDQSSAACNLPTPPTLPPPPPPPPASSAIFTAASTWALLMSAFVVFFK